jgi:transcriptional regulator with XRE-family HTH domain
VDEVAEFTGMDRIKLRRYRRGETWPSWDTQRQFRELLAVDPVANLPDPLPTR